MDRRETHSKYIHTWPDPKETVVLPAASIGTSPSPWPPDVSQLSIWHHPPACSRCVDRVPRLKEGTDGVLWQARVTEPAHVCSSSYHLACLSDRKERPCALSQVDHEISWPSVAMDRCVPASPLRHGSSRLPADANNSSGPGTWPHLAPIPSPANLEPKLRVSCSPLLSLSLCCPRPPDKISRCQPPACSHFPSCLSQASFHEPYSRTCAGPTTACSASCPVLVRI